MAEPTYTALILVALGILMGASVIFSRAAGRIGVPVALIFLGIGMVAGSEGIGQIHFESYSFTFRLGTVALVLILFDGGLNTPVAAVREGIRPAGVLATVGVLGTAGITAGGAKLLGFSWPEAMLLGAIVSSTDAAAVFSVLRGSGLHLKRRVGVTLELESGLNDPMAVILTVALTQAMVSSERPGLHLLREVFVQLILGGAFGLGIGWAGRQLLRRVPLTAGGLYPVLTLSLAFLSFGLPTLVDGSGFLSVYLTAVMLGNEAIRYRAGLLRVHDALAWLAQVGMFLVLGLLVFPSHLWGVAWVGLGVSLVLTFIARPVMAFLSLLPFGFSLKEMGYVGWVGLRGAVPIILATYPVLRGAPDAKRLFDVVFFIVVFNALIPGATVKWVTRKLGLVSNAPPAPHAVLEITSTQLLKGELLSFYISPAVAAANAAIADLPFPPSAVVTLIVRGDELVPPKGNTVLQPGDHLYVFSKPEDQDLLRLVLGEPEQD